MLIHALFDNNENISQLPPSAMTGNTTTINGQNYYAGSSVSSSNPFRVFDYSGNGWRSNSGYTGAGALYNGTTALTSTSSGNIGGDWIQLQLPSPKTLFTFNLTGPSTSSNKPRRVVILGSNNTANPWTILFDLPAGQYLSYINNDTTTYLVNSSTPFTYYRLVITQGTSQPYVDVIEWKLFEDKSTNRNTLIYRNPSLYGRFKIHLIALYADSFNFSDTNQLLCISSPQLNVPGSNNTLLVLHEVPVAELPTKKVYNLFSDDLTIMTELNGYIELYFKRNNVNAPFKRVLLVLQAERINYLSI